MDLTMIVPLVTLIILIVLSIVGILSQFFYFGESRNYTKKYLADNIKYFINEHKSDKTFIKWLRSLKERMEKLKNCSEYAYTKPYQYFLIDTPFTHRKQTYFILDDKKNVKFYVTKIGEEIEQEIRHISLFTIGGKKQAIKTCIGYDEIDDFIRQGEMSVNEEKIKNDITSKINEVKI